MQICFPQFSVGELNWFHFDLNSTQHLWDEQEGYHHARTYQMTSMLDLINAFVEEQEQIKVRLNVSLW